MLASLALGCELWTVVPAPTLPTLALAVAIPELAPWGVLASLTVNAIAALAARGRVRAIALTLGIVALACALVPLAEVPGTANATEAALRAAGAFAAARAPGALRRPVDLALTVRGYPPAAAVRVVREPVVLADGSRLALDLYRSRVPGQRPTLFVLYGGAWIFGSLADSAELARAYAALGYTVVALDYRHAPQFRFPTQLEDVRAGIATVARNARAWNVDPARVALLGRSAGAQLALLAAYAREPVRVRAAVGYYAPADLTAGYADPPRPDPADVRRILRAYLGGPPAGRERAYRAASPVAAVRPQLPPTLLVIGDRDELVRPRFQRELRDALRAAGDRVVALELPWANHAFDAVPSGLGGQLARYATQRFLQAAFERR